MYKDLQIVETIPHYAFDKEKKVGPMLIINVHYANSKRLKPLDSLF